jgi:hypothetical protein
MKCSVSIMEFLFLAHYWLFLSPFGSVLSERNTSQDELASRLSMEWVESVCLTLLLVDETKIILNG